MYRLKIYIIMPKNILPGTICNFLVLLYTLCVLKDIFIFSAEAKDVILFFHTTTRYFSLCHNFVHLLARKPNLEKFSIYSSKFFPNFLLSESSFTCPWLQASGLGRRLLLFLKRSVWNSVVNWFIRFKWNRTSDWRVLQVFSKQSVLKWRTVIKMLINNTIMSFIRS